MYWQIQKKILHESVIFFQCQKKYFYSGNFFNLIWTYFGVIGKKIAFCSRFWFFYLVKNRLFNKKNDFLPNLVTTFFQCHSKQIFPNKNAAYFFRDFLFIHRSPKWNTIVHQYFEINAILIKFDNTAFISKSCHTVKFAFLKGKNKN